MQAVAASRPVNARHRHARAVAAGEQLRPRHRADRRGVEAGELHPLARHAVEVRRLLLRRAKRPDVAVAEVVDEDDDEVGFLQLAGSGVQGDQRGEQQGGEEWDVVFHGDVIPAFAS